MNVKARVFVSDTLSNCERQALERDISPHLPAGVDGEVKLRFLEALSAAVAHAKPGIDLREAMKIDAEERKNIFRPPPRRARHRKRRPKLVKDLPASQRVQLSPKGSGRPRDAWKSNLMGDVWAAMRRAGIRGGYWKTDVETRLAKIFRVCTKHAGQQIGGSLRRIWDQSDLMRTGLHVPAAPGRE
jgi:hypothetical protein